MVLDSEHLRIIEDSARAMQAGPAGEADIMALFAEDAVWVEPYTGQRRSHEGKKAILAALKEMWTRPAPPGFNIATDRIDIEGSSIRVDWTCSATGFPNMMRGYSLYTIGAEKKIARLELFITEAPPIRS